MERKLDLCYTPLSKKEDVHFLGESSRLSKTLVRGEADDATLHYIHCTHTDCRRRLGPEAAVYLNAPKALWNHLFGERC